MLEGKEYYEWEGYVERLNFESVNCVEGLDGESIVFMFEFLKLLYGQVGRRCREFLYIFIFYFCIRNRGLYFIEKEW